MSDPDRYHTCPDCRANAVLEARRAKPELVGGYCAYCDKAIREDEIKGDKHIECGWKFHPMPGPRQFGAL